MSKKYLKIIIPAAAAAVAIPTGITVARMLDRSSTAPVIALSSADWSKRTVASVTTPATFGSSDLSYYEYCNIATSSIENCTWSKISDSSVTIVKGGKSYIWFRGVAESGTISEVSNMLTAKIDRGKPEADATVDVDTSSISLTVDANDSLSGIDKVFYSLDGGTYEEGELSYQFTGLAAGSTHKVKVKNYRPRRQHKIPSVFRNARKLRHDRQSHTPKQS